PGGIGKTRLAMELAQIFAYPQEGVVSPAYGVYFVALQPLNSPDLIIPAIADVLDFQFFQADDPKRQLLNHIREKSLLRALDNFEHLLDGAGMISDLLADAPGVKILVTSREPLNLQEEWSYPVKGMLYPPPDVTANPEDYSAVRLFVQNARRIRGDFSLAQER